MSWVATAVATTAIGGAVYKGIAGNQQKQKNKGFIDQSFDNAKLRQATQQKYAAENQAESLNARGLATTGYSPVHAAMSGGVPGAPVNAPSTIGEQRLSDTAGQFQLENADLNLQRKQALAKNNTDYANTIVDSVLGGVNGVIGAVGVKGDLNASAAMSGGAGGPSASRTMSGDVNPIDAALSAGSFRGIHPIDPLNNPSSTWNVDPGSTRVGAGESNANFTV